MAKEPLPKIIRIPPGPEGKHWVEQDSLYASQSYTRVYPLVIQRGEGVMVEDVDGNRYLDFTSGIGVNSTGHCHPKIVEAINKQASQFIHMSGTDFYYTSQVRLAKRLGEITPGKGPKRVFFGNSGAEAIEAAFKLARYHTKRPLMLAFIGAFHGRTMGALSLTGSKTAQRSRFSPLVPGVYHAPYAYCYRCPFNLEYGDCGTACVGWIRETLFKTIIPPEEVAAIFVEPIQGEGGYIVPPAEFHQGLYSLAKEYGILYVTDEVQTGMGRTGKMMASEHFGIVPDIIALAKGTASGLPLGAIVASSEVMDWTAGSHASTFGGNPVSCEAALTTIDLLEEGLIENAARIGKYILDRLNKIMDQHPFIGDVRGRGLMIGIEIVKDKKTKEMGIKERDEIIQRCFRKGLLILGCGQNTVRFVPPLIITREHADTALSIFEKVLTEVERGGLS